MSTRDAKSPAEHTPGPWSVEDNEEDAVNAIIVSGELEIADVWSTDDLPLVANARLIAAAPDLLKALQAVVRVADRQTDEFDMARAAIAKATEGAL